MTCRITFTLLPRGEWLSEPQVSIYVAMYLDAPGRRAELTEFDFARRWPEVVRQLPFSAYVLDAGGPRRLGRLQAEVAIPVGEAMKHWREVVEDETEVPDDTPQPLCADADETQVKGYAFAELVDAVADIYGLAGQAQVSALAPAAARPDIDWWGTEELRAARFSAACGGPPNPFREFAEYHLPAEDRIGPAAIAPPNFNERLSELAQNPALLRLFGFVVDARLIPDPGVVIPERGAFAAGLDADTLSPQGVHVSSTWSAIETGLVGNRRLATMTSGPGDRFRQRGFCVLDPARMRLVQYPLDTTVMGVMQARQAAREAATQQISAGIVAAEPPSITSIGFSLYHRQVLEDLQGAEGRQRQLAGDIAVLPSGKVTADAPVLYARDVERGYRVDARWSATGRWHSLCDRVQRLETEAGTVDLRRFGNREGVVSLCLSEAADGSQKSSQRVMGWMGWSIVLPRPENPVDAAGDPQEQAEPEVPWRVVEGPAAGSLPPLRFGHSYAFRLRSADLAGNSWSLGDAAGGSAGIRNATTPEEAFLRLEPVSPPIIISPDDPSPGERPLLLVAHSRGRGPSRSERTLHPPGTAFATLEMHGAIDGLDDDDAYELMVLASGRPRPPADMRKAEFTPYVADPAARGVSLILEGGDGETPLGALWFPAGIKREADEGLTLRLHAGAFRARAARRAVDISLPLGETRRLRLRSAVRPQDRAVLAFDESDQPEPPFRVTPPVDVLLIHPTPLPLSPPEHGAAAFQARERLHTHVVFEDPGLQTHEATTSRVTFEARWVELFDVPAKPGWTRLERSARIASEDIAAPADYPLGFIAGRTVPVGATLADRVAALAAQPVMACAMDDAARRFDFQDTFTRELTITPVGYTRHAEFFPRPAGEEPVPAPGLAGRAVTLRAPSTANPTAPSPTYILPTWRRARDRDLFRHRIVQTSEGWAFRVFLQRDWRAEERLAVVFGLGPRAEAWSAITQDPLVRSEAALAALVPDDIDGAPEALVLAPMADAYLTDGLPANAEAVVIRHLQVGYDEGKNLRFADIALRARPRSFQPFVRLALARYNPYSIAGAELSKVVTADWSQPAGSRSVTVVRQRDGRRLVTVAPDGADESPTGTRTRFQAHVERMDLDYHDEYAWEVVPGTLVELTAQGTADARTWQGLIDPPSSNVLGRRRIVVRELFDLYDAAAASGSRLMSFEIVDL